MLLVVVTLLCVWLGFKVNAARRQKEAVDAILIAGGKIRYDYQLLPNVSSENHWNYRNAADALPSGLPILRKLFGEDCFRKVIIVQFDKANIPEAVFTQLSNLPDLEQIYLSNVKLVPASNVPRSIQDSDFELFGQLGRLEFLEIDFAETNGSGLTHIINLRSLRVLALQHTTIGDAGMEIVGTISQLELLQLDRTPITDEGLKHLHRLVNLKSLWLQEDQGVTDAGLEFLSGLKKLKAVHLWHTRVTSEGARELQKSLPNCKISGP